MKIGAVALVLGFTAVAAACALFIADALPDRYAARGVMVATPKPLPSGTASPDLVRTYAALIRTDPSVIRSLATSTGQSRNEAREALSIRPIGDSLALRLSVTAPTAAKSRRGLAAVVRGFRSSRAAAVLDPDAIQLLERSPTRPTTVPPGFRSSRSVLVTTPSGSEGESQGPSRLAADYAGVIPEDDALLEAVGRQVGRSPDDIRRNLSVRSDSGTSVMRFAVEGSSYEAARATLVELMRRLRDNGGGAGRIEAGTIRVAHFPDRTDSASRSNLPSGIVGGLLGACLGIMVAMGLTRRPRNRHAASS